MPGFKWFSSSFKVNCRLDYFFFSKSMSPSVVQIKVMSNIFSDLSDICCKLSSEDKKIKHGPGFWKFNSSLLTDKRCADMITEQIPQFMPKYGNLIDKALFCEMNAD